MSDVEPVYFMHGALPAGDGESSEYGESTKDRKGTMKGEGIEDGWCIKDTRVAMSDVEPVYFMHGALPAEDGEGSEYGEGAVKGEGAEDGWCIKDTRVGEDTKDGQCSDDGDVANDGDVDSDGDDTHITEATEVLRQHLHPAALVAHQVLHHYGCATEANFNYPAFRDSQTAIMRGLFWPDMGPIKPVTQDCVLPFLIAGKIQKRILAAFASSYTRTMEEINLGNGFRGRTPPIPVPVCMRQPSDREIYRITLSLCQVDAYLKNMDHRRHENLERAEESAATFFTHMTPWEKERIVTILEILSLHVQKDLYYLSLQDPSFRGFLDEQQVRLSSDEKFEILRKHLLAVPNNYPKGKLDSKLFSRLASFIPARLFVRNLTTKNSRARTNIYKKRFRQAVPWSVLLEHFIHKPVADCASNETVDSDRIMTVANEDPDPDKGPSNVWRAAHADMASPYWVGMDKLATMRHLGYVFWDAERKPLDWVTDRGVLSPLLTQSKPFMRFDPFGVSRREDGGSKGEEDDDPKEDEEDA